MPRIRSARSDVSDGDVDGMAERENEYLRLQRQYRLMENDRKAYIQESQDHIKRYKREISLLEAEQEELNKELRLCESQSNQTKDEIAVSDLDTLSTQKLDVQKQIENEKKVHEEIRANIREMEKKVKTQNTNMGGSRMSTNYQIQTKRNIRKLENQLQLSNNRFCEALKVNTQMRGAIDNLRVDRNRFDSLYKRLNRELENLHQETGEVIDQSTQAYDSRDEAQAKMILLREKADKDLQQHNTEMKELVRIIDHDRKLREFMNTKGKERNEDPQLVYWRQRKEALEQDRKAASQVDSVESYAQAFERIQEITEGEQDIDHIVRRFIETEDRNFALFNYVNEQNNQIERLHEQIQQIKDEIEEFNKQGVELEEDRTVILKKLEDKQNKETQIKNKSISSHTTVVKILDQLLAGIDSLFNKINCDSTAIDEMLGVNQGPTYQNMLQYLGIIEERTNQLLLIQAYLNSQKETDDYTSKKQTSLLGEGPQPVASTHPIAAPNIGDEYDSEGSELSEDDSRPLTRNELASRAIKSVKKRENATKKEGFRYDLSDAREKAKKKEKKSR